MPFHEDMSVRSKLFRKLPILRLNEERAIHVICSRVSLWNYRSKWNLRGTSLRCQFKSPGHGIGGRGGKGYGRQPSYPGTPQGYPYSPGYSGMSPMPVGHRGSEGAEGYYQDDGYDYQQGASDDSRDTQHSMGDMSQQQMGFGGEYGNGSQQGYDQGGDTSYGQDRTQGGDGGGGDGGGGGNNSGTGNSGQDSGTGGNKSPPDIKYEVTPVPFMKADDFELIEIDPDEEDDL